MGIYSSKFNESAIEDTIQTPDDVGVDLDQVEEDIMGKDGIESHRDEVEDAQEGMIGDPVEEAAYVMFESEYNYNQLMEAIGIAELREASYGREMLYEAVDIKGFLNKVKEIIQRMFASIATAVRNVVDKLTMQVKRDQKFVQKYEKEIKEGFNLDWEYTGVAFVNRGDYVAKFKQLFDAESVAKDLEAECTKKVEDAKAGRDVKDYLENKGYRAEIIKKVVSEGADDIAGMVEKLQAELYGEKKTSIKKSDVTVEFVINTLKSESELKAIREHWGKLKEGYKKSLKAIDNLKKTVDRSNKDLRSNVMNVCEMGARQIKFERNVANSAYTVFIKAARMKRAQARALAHVWAKAAKKAGKGKDKKQEVQHNSANIMDRITLI